MGSFLQNIDTKLDGLRNIAEQFLQPLTLLAIRLYMANIFFASGFGKLKDTLNGNFSDVVFLFEQVHPIPFFHPVFSAIAGMGGEFICGVLLAFGLFGRFAALGLLVITLMIEFAVPAVYELSNQQHYFWMLLLFVPIVFGSGKLSGDHFLLKYIRKS